MRTTYITKPLEVERKWYVVDAEGQTLGRMASQVASVLRGKHKPIFAPHADAGDYVIIINAEKIEVTGNKREQKIYRNYSGYPGGLKERNFAEVQSKKPEEIIERAIKGMLPKNAMGRKMYRKLRVYAGPDHPHENHKPEPLSFD